jgi:hypothetical protein
VSRIYLYIRSDMSICRILVAYQVGLTELLVIENDVYVVHPLGTEVTKNSSGIRRYRVSKA